MGRYNLSITSKDGRLAFYYFSSSKRLPTCKQWICFNIPYTVAKIYLDIVFLFFFLAMPHACGILVPWPGIEPTPPKGVIWSHQGSSSISSYLTFLYLPLRLNILSYFIGCVYLKKYLYLRPASLFHWVLCFLIDVKEIFAVTYAENISSHSVICL